MQASPIDIIAAAVNEATPATYRILIIDDSPHDRSRIRSLLEEDRSAIHVFSECGTAKEGIVAAAVFRPDCILLGENLPDMTGLQALPSLSAPNGEALCAIVMLTGLHDDETVASAMKAGAQDCLAKSRCSPESLKRTVRSAVEQFRLVRARRIAESRYRAIVGSSEDAILSISADGIVETWNTGASYMFGWSASEAIGRPVESLLVSTDRSFAFSEIYKQLQGGEPVRVEADRLHRNGDFLQTSAIYTPILEQGVLVAVSAIIRDMRDSKEAEQRIRLLAGEVAHRSKNMLTVIQAIACQTGRRAASMPEFQEQFGMRLRALSGSVDLLLAEDWKGVTVSQLVRTQLASFADIDGTRIQAAGPVRLLLPDAAQSLGLALHELATNAMKYGALSVPEGRIEIFWDIDAPDAPDPRFRMSWRECNGPPVSPPKTKGFGHIVINRMVGDTLKGDVTLEFLPEGVLWQLQMPADHTLAA